MRELQAKFGPRGFTILGFPCNQFGLQENCTNAEIPNMLKYVRPGEGYEPNFPMFQKIIINGPDAQLNQPHPLFAMAKRLIPEVDSDYRNTAWVFDQRPSKLCTTPCKPDEVRWNFEKFLCDRRGVPVGRFSHRASPLGLAGEIERLLADHTQPLSEGLPEEGLPQAEQEKAAPPRSPKPPSPARVGAT